MDIQNYDALKIENQLCFPLYAASRSIIRRYKPFLDELDLTYTQYLAMMVLWQEKAMTVKELGNMLYLDSGTLTPLLKKLEAKGLITRKRSEEDERNLIITITAEGEQLREQAVDIPAKMAQVWNLKEEEAALLYQILYKILRSDIAQTE